jgi:hypothetical protein
VLSLWAAPGGLVIGLALGLLGDGGSTLAVSLLLVLGVEPKVATFKQTQGALFRARPAHPVTRLRAQLTRRGAGRGR